MPVLCGKNQSLHKAFHWPLLYSWDKAQPNFKAYIPIFMRHERAWESGKVVRTNVWVRNLSQLCSKSGLQWKAIPQQVKLLTWSPDSYNTHAGLKCEYILKTYK